MSLASSLEELLEDPTECLYVGKADRYGLVAKIDAEEKQPSGDCCEDEQLWTFLVACGFAAAKDHGVHSLTKLLTGVERPLPQNPKIWFEVGPIPPRVGERASWLDLAIGCLGTRSAGGVELSPNDDPWACFCECKWYSDLANDVSNDVHRDQLSRLIESLLCFQGVASGSRHFLQHLHLTLITPACFKPINDVAMPRSRMYQYKFDEYVTQKAAAILRDIDGCSLPKRNEARFAYPPRRDLEERIERLALRWVTFDDLFVSLPDSALRGQIAEFWRAHGNYQGRDSACTERMGVK